MINKPMTIKTITAVFCVALPSITNAYPSQKKFWVLPYKVEWSTSSTLRHLDPAHMIESALATTFERGQPLMSREEESLALKLTGASAEAAFKNNDWIRKVANAANVDFILTGSVLQQGSTVTITTEFSNFRRPHSSRATSSQTGNEKYFASLCLKTLRMFLMPLVDNTWPWADEVPTVTDDTVQNGLIRGIGYLGGHQYPLAIDQFCALTHQNPPSIDAAYWLIQSYANAGETHLAVTWADDFLAKNPSDARAEEIRRLRHALPPTRGREPTIDHT